MIRFGSNTPAEGLRQLPSFVGSTENENNSALGTGAAQVNLRAFGSRNTLTIAFPRYNHVCAAHVRARLRIQFRRCLARDRRAAGRPNRRQGSDFILCHSSKPALLSTAGERKIFAPFWDLNLDTPAWAGGQTRRSRETNFTQGRGGARTGEAKYGSGKPLRLGLFA